MSHEWTVTSRWQTRFRHCHPEVNQGQGGDSCTGTVERAPAVELSWPYWLLPQHHTEPSVFTTHV